jgi:hypothetical protein
MIALLVVLTFVVLLLGVFVAGLLRSHADILRSLHELGVGVGDPVGSAAVATSVPVNMSPGPAGLSLGAAPAIAGQTPFGDARAVAVDNSDRLTLLGFLSSGCQSCAGFWAALQQPDQHGLPDGTRIVIVTKGPELEITPQVRALTSGQVPVLMSTEAWHDYEVPGSPFFVLIDGATGQKIGQGVATQIDQLVDLVGRAQSERPPGGASRPAAEPGLDGPAREVANDDALRAAGILPGDPSLYPRSLEDVFPYSVSGAPPSH